MATGAYSFIDIAVLDGVRNHFAVGNPLVILSQDLETILWINGPGASLLGRDDIESTLDSKSDLGTTVNRQIKSTPGFPHLDKSRPLTIRLNSGLNSTPVSCVISNILLPDGENGILLALPGGVPAGMAEDKIAARAISGLCTPDHHAVLLNANGEAVCAEDRFRSIGIEAEILRELVAEVATENDRLVKRMVRSKSGEIAVGIGRLVDDPALHLLIVVTASSAEGITDTRVVDPDEPANVQPEAASTEMMDEPDSDDNTEPRVEEPKPEPAISTDMSEEDAAATSAEDDMADQAEELSSPSEDQRIAAAPPTEAVSASQTGLDAVRFVWRTDAEGRFSSISQEFTDAMGPAMADVIGRPFSQVAEALGIDKDGEIAGLLARRDTWSGKSVMWPVEGAGERVTVDLAALPAYSRDRVFEGFRGFGVIRLSETLADPAAASLSFPSITNGTPDTENGAETHVDAAADKSPQPEDVDPFLGEKPAIVVSRTPERRDSDKIIRLASRRQGAFGTQLSENEESAFREIGKQLKDDDAEPATAREELSPDDADVNRDGEQPKTIEKQSDNQNNREPPLKPIDYTPSAFASAEKPSGGGVDVSVLEQLPVAILIRSGDQLHFANPEFLRLTGYTSLRQLDDAGGFDVLFAGPDRFPDDDDSDPSSALRLVTSDGVEKLCEAHLRSVRWDDHRALMLTIRPSPVFSPPMDGPNPVGDDLNERIQELTAILDTATDGVVLVTPSGTIRSLNHSAEALFGFDSSDLLGKPFSVLFATESQRAAADYLSGLSENGVASVLNDGREIIGREAQGRFIPLFMTMGKLPGDRGYCAVMRDITPWKRAEQELTQARGQAEHASSLKTDFLAKISHEVRTPLNAIIGFSELMLDEKFGPIGNTRYRDYLRDINSSGNHVLDLVNDLLDISKIEAGEQELEFESVSLNDALADTVALMQPEANRERVIIRSSFASNLPDVVADLRSVKQIALNLLSNAIKFTPAGGQVIVSTVYQQDGNVIIRVRDTGIGMTRLEIDQAMKPFRQVSTLKSRRGDGTGLGLPLTKAMVESNRAGFTIESTPDEGTIVEVTFPSTRVLAD